MVSLRAAHPSYGLHVVGFSLGGGVAAMVAGLLDGAISPDEFRGMASTNPVGIVSQTPAASG